MTLWGKLLGRRFEPAHLHKELNMIKRKLRMGRLYKGKFPRKESTLELAKAVIELQKEVNKLRAVLKNKHPELTDLQIDSPHLLSGNN